MNKTVLKVLTALSLTGFILSFITLTQHYDLMTNGLEQKSFCSINEYVNCNAVNSSHYSEIFSIPVAGLGLLYYLLLFIYFLVGVSSNKNKKGALHFCFFLSFIGLVVSAIMAYLSFVKIEALCLLCTGMYFLNIFIFVLIPYSFGSKWKNIPAITLNYIKAAFMKSNSLGYQPKIWTHIIANVIVVLIGSFILLQIGHTIEEKKVTKKNNIHEPPKELTLEEIIEIHFKQPQTPIDYGNRPHRGNPTAPVKIIEFSDFECPFCRIAAEYLHEELKQYEGQVVFYFANYPLDQACNPYLQRQMHLQACQAAYAATCSSQKNLFWSYHDEVFANQKKLSPQTLLEIAKKQNIPTTWMTECMASVETKNSVLADIQLGEKLNVSGTPAVFINGRKLQQWRDPRVLQTVIEKELNK